MLTGITYLRTSILFDICFLPYDGCYNVIKPEDTHDGFFLVFKATVAFLYQCLFGRCTLVTLGVFIPKEAVQVKQNKHIKSLSSIILHQFKHIYIRLKPFLLGSILRLELRIELIYYHCDSERACAGPDSPHLENHKWLS